MSLCSNEGNTVVIHIFNRNLNIFHLVPDDGDVTSPVMGKIHLKYKLQKTTMRYALAQNELINIYIIMLYL